MSKELGKSYLNIGRYRACSCIAACEHWEDLLEPVFLSKKPTKDMPVGKRSRANSKPSERKPV